MKFGTLGNAIVSFVNVYKKEENEIGVHKERHFGTISPPQRVCIAMTHVEKYGKDGEECQCVR